METLNLEGNFSIFDLSSIEGLGRIRELNLNETRICDINPCSGMPLLENLFIMETQVSDLSPLFGARRLQQLNIAFTRVNSFLPIEDKSFQYLDISSTRASQKNKNKIKQIVRSKNETCVIIDK